MAEPRRRVIYGQLEQLWEYLNQNKELATGFNKTAQARENNRRMWEEIAENLNSHGAAAVKDWKGWCKYWNDYKSKLKKMAAALRQAHQKAGGGQSNIKELTDIEKKFLLILGDKFGCGLPGVRVEPFEEGSTEIEDKGSAPNLTKGILVGFQLAGFRDEGQSGSSSSSQPQPFIFDNNTCTPRPSPRRCPCRTHAPATSLFHRSSQLSPRCPIRRPACTAAALHDSPESGSTPPHTPPIIQSPPASYCRHRPRRSTTFTAEFARRGLLTESRKLMKLKQEKLKILKSLKDELREIKELLKNK